MAEIFGDGIHDDGEGIQQLLDNGDCLVKLLSPTKFYLIGRTLKIHSGQQFILPRYAVIRLADGSNCHMMENYNPTDSDYNIEINGGIWDYNNIGQEKNPIHFPSSKFPSYTGYMFRFINIKNFRMSDMTLKDPINFCITLDIVSYFSIENITFDFNYGNPWAVNMDGVHIEGNCHFGLIRNLKGSCYDDLVALNSDEGLSGPISNIEIDGIYSENCHSAVRLLSVNNIVEHIHIHNVYGTFYQYCIGITKYYDGESIGWFDSIVIENIHASKAPRLTVYQKDGTFAYPLIWFESNILVKNIVIDCIFRNEKVSGVPFIKIENAAIIENISISNVVQENKPDAPSAVIENYGIVKILRLNNIRTNTGEVYLDGGETYELSRY